ncbi:TATA-binding protein-associated factor mot1 [Entomophthora muscae]|uniref:TATA-binding protein-associated factor mot1 n=1 Tax=Entomophthora muscae TaxID=34485 RepID=A0ACC2URS2_9FUNG|nr:TATA-binding protein-associated factor mot1 [Entomophthora muscae]
MTTRLDRLVLLLDTGSAAGIRSTAATQLGDIMRQHPTELKNLLSRVSIHLRSSSWETRIAAGQAIGAIAKNADQWDPAVKVEDMPLPDVESKSVLSFKELDIEAVMQRGKKLLGSAGKEYDHDLSHLSQEERLKELKKSLKQRLGLESEFFADEFLDDTDLMINHEPPQASQASQAEQIDMSALSARERNRLKRKSKKDAKDRLNDSRKRHQAPQRVATVDSQIRPSGIKSESMQNDGKVVIESRVSMAVVEDPRDWPFEDYCEALCIDLFDPNWTIRHGAALGLREILKYRGNDAGKSKGHPTEVNQRLHDEWLEDVCIRLLCVFALDRFGDFVSDQVVAPVRETCSQTLGTLIQYLAERHVLNTQQCLLKLIFQTPGAASVWEPRHSGLLGLKYVMAVRADLVESLLDGTVGAVLLGLQDVDDDVRGVSASTLIPVTQQFVELLPQKAFEVTVVLWRCLAEMKDDLSASTGSVMELLAKLFSFPIIMQSFQQVAATNPQFALQNLVPILFGFFRHTISSVRLAVLTTLKLFLEADSICGWVDFRVLRLVFQNLVLEEKVHIFQESGVLWQLMMKRLGEAPHVFFEVIRSCVPNWFTILMTPLGTPINQQLLFVAKRGADVETNHNIDLGMLNQDFALVSQEIVVRNRLAGGRALGELMKILPLEEIALLFDGSLRFYIQSTWGIHQQLAAAIVEEWFNNHTCGTDVHQSLAQMFLAQFDVNPSTPFQESFPHLRRLRGECQALLNTAAMEGQVPQSHLPALPLNVDGESPDGFSLATAQQLVGATFDRLVKACAASSHTVLEERRRRVLTAIGLCEELLSKVEIQVSASLACAVVSLGVLPAKLTPLIRALMNSIKFESVIELQTRSATGLARLVQLCSEQQPKPNPTDKIVKNLCAFLCSDSAITPVLQDNQATDTIYSLTLSQGTLVRGRGRPALHDVSCEDEATRAARLVRRGAELALERFCTVSGPQVFTRIPKLWELIYTRLELHVSIPDIHEQLSLVSGQDLIDSLQVLSVVVPFAHATTHQDLVPTIPWILRCLQSRYSLLRYVAARCLSVVSDTLLSPCMQAIITSGLPLLLDPTSVTNRQGAAEAIYFIVQSLGAKILPYVIFLVVPVLGRMSDTDDHVRLVASNCFALLINLIPLESGIPDPSDLPPELVAQRSTERRFLSQLMDNSQVEDFRLPVKINAELRSYQQDGVNWLAFLYKYQLHGILCDDMGLGKTLQSICILASTHHLRNERYQATGALDAAPLPSLVVCPPTLIGHWFHEIKNYCHNLNPMTYTGVASERKKLLPQIGKHDVVIMSYDIVRNDVDELGKILWNYCILDEGHIIKNGKTKITKSVKAIRANHRLILSGTPIQNNVLELWSLFDFLMPGFLGTERSFSDRYSKPILASRDAKSSSREQEAGALALEALHKQVLPFLLRRLKEDVLDDLPPKIIQDYYCDLGDVQKQLYDDFSKTQNPVVRGTAEPSKAPHVFQALQYLRKLCNHPLLVLSPKHPKYTAIMNKVGNEAALHDLVHAPKLLALRQLLNDCGIGAESDSGEEQLVGGAVSQHRVLIFCQLKSMLDMVENDLLKRHLPGVSYLRLDGSVDTMARHEMVQTFNRDPSIDVLLLTTQVGGLGLNLTGADTVIFVEHDWNPMKDLQAMDRAHRIGQKKVVNVYRLVARDTLEEKIMGLQKFKLNIANSVVNQQNSGLASMGTNQLLDLFSPTDQNSAGISATSAENGAGDDAAAAAAASLGGTGFKQALEGLEKLWDEKQYEEEFDLDNFISGLKHS